MVLGIALVGSGASTVPSIVVDTAALALATAIVVNYTKFAISATLSNREQWVRLFVYGVAATLVALTATLPSVTDWQDGVMAGRAIVVAAFPVGTTAIVSYHVLTNNLFPDPAPTPTEPPKPAA